MGGERYVYDEEASAAWHMDVVHEIEDDEPVGDDQGRSSSPSGGREASGEPVKGE